MIEPGADIQVYLTFPVEVGVFIGAGKKFEILDIFSLAKQKYSLYGEPRNGLICKFWESRVHDTIPESDPMEQGIIKLNLSNGEGNWVTLTRAVFNAYGMKIYYSGQRVSMQATLKLRDDGTAETDFKAEPVEEGMQKSMEVYTTKMLTITSTRFVMEHGL